jgi:hypothetical protein
MLSKKRSTTKFLKVSMVTIHLLRIIGQDFAEKKTYVDSDVIVELVVAIFAKTFAFELMSEHYKHNITETCGRNFTFYVMAIRVYAVIVIVEQIQRDVMIDDPKTLFRFFYGTIFSRYMYIVGNDIYI